MSNIIKGLSFESPNEIKRFINSNESGLYTGINADGVEVIVYLEKRCWNENRNSTK